MLSLFCCSEHHRRTFVHKMFKMFACERCVFLRENTKRYFNINLLFSHNKRKKIAIFVIFSEFMLDILERPWYIIGARVKE